MTDAKSVWNLKKIVESNGNGSYVSDCFPVNVGLRQGCVITPWLFKVYVDGVVQEVNARVIGKGLELLSVNGGRFE